MKTGFVYWMLNQRNGFTKIGFSTNPTYREATLQAEEPEIEIIALMPGTLELERFFHNKFSEKRLRGEWFNLSGEDFVELFNSHEFSLIRAPFMRIILPILGLKLTPETTALEVAAFLTWQGFPARILEAAQ